MAGGNNVPHLVLFGLRIADFCISDGVVLRGGGGTVSPAKHTTDDRVNIAICGRACGHVAGDGESPFLALRLVKRARKRATAIK